MAPKVPSRPFIGICVIIACLTIYLHIKKSGEDAGLRRIYLRHSVFFLLCYFIVFFQRAADFSLGIIDEFSLNVEDYLWANSPHVVSKACALSLLGLSTFVYGYNSYNYDKISETNYRYCFRFKTELVLFAFLLLIVYIFTAGIGDFTKQGENETNMSILVILQAVILSIIVIYTYECKHKINIQNEVKQLLLPLSLIVIYLMIFFLTANRGGGIKVCCMILVAYLYLKSDKVNYKKIIIYALFGALSMTIIGLIRTMETKDVNEAANLLSAKETISPLTVELSGSVNTVHVALANYPSKQDYNCGTSFFQGFTVLVPGLSRITRDLKSENSDDIITKLYFGGYVPNWGWGLGSSAVADVYISFGVFGILLVFFLFGKFLHYLEYGLFAIVKSPYFLVLSFCVYSQLISLCRGSFASLFLSWNYALIIVFFCCRKKLIIKNE